MPAMDNAFDSLLQRFLPISLNEMKNVRLMNRSDTKFITDKKTLEKLLRTAAQLYYVQEINGLRISNYQTIYWDTPEHTFYRIHHNGNKPRIKIRTRTYADSNLTFLEIKNKDNHGKTSKKRIAITQPDIRKDQEGQAFIQKQTGYSIQSIHPCLQNRFHRNSLNPYSTQHRMPRSEQGNHNPYTNGSD